ncbi:hypothetical protein [Streptomyces sp. HUAS ZL42]|uniref:hypothetical protein n=1 Tax=Streptomyces sp. HUAS ZL42 TaxID=3231715 RepID=UPI00345F11D2
MAVEGAGAHARGGRGVVLAALDLPRQDAFPERGGTRRATVQLAMFTGVFNLRWAKVTVLMNVRPGSTTGA